MGGSSQQFFSVWPNFFRGAENPLFTGEPSISIYLAFCGLAAAGRGACRFINWQGVKLCYYSCAAEPASGRVMQKLGMSCEGRLRQHVEKWRRFEDLKIYGILKGNYDRHRRR